jgi:hypothetical protein
MTIFGDGMLEDSHPNFEMFRHLLLAQSGHSPRCNAMSAIGGKADMGRGPSL